MPRNESPGSWRELNCHRLSFEHGRMQCLTKTLGLESSPKKAGQRAGNPVANILRAASRINDWSPDSTTKMLTFQGSGYPTLGTLITDYRLWRCTENQRYNRIQQVLTEILFILRTFASAKITLVVISTLILY